MSWMTDVEFGRTHWAGLPMRAWTRLGAALGLLFLTGPAADVGHQSTGVPQRVLYAAGLALFAFLYVSLLPPAGWLGRLTAQAETIGIAALVGLATILLAAGAPSSFVALYVYAVAAAGFLFEPFAAAVVTLLVAAGVGAGLAAADATASASAAVLLTIVAIGAMTAALGSQLRTNRQLRSARNELAGSPSTRSDCASPATSTTCSATACR